MKWLSRVFNILLLTYICVAPSFAQQRQSETLGWPYTRDTLNSLSYIDPVDFLHLICDGLVGYDPDMGLVPLLVDSWETSEDNLVYTFHLREGILFHDGSSLTADDVVFSFGQMENETLSSVEKIDDFTVRFSLTTPTPSFLGRLAGYAIFSQEASEIGVDLTTNPVCVGAYKVDTWNANETLELVADEEWFGIQVFGELPFDSLVIRIIPDPEARRLAFENQTIDVALIPFDEIPNLVNYPDGQLAITDDYSTNMLVYNLNDTVMADVRVRQALSMAIDREQLVGTVFQGNLTPAQGFYPPYLLNVAADFSYDLDKAAALLDEAGWTDGDGDGIRECHGCLYAQEGRPLEFEVLVNVQPLQTSQFVAEALSVQLEAIGISIEIFPASPEDYWQRLSNCEIQTAVFTARTPYGDLGGGIQDLFNSLQNCGYLSETTLQITGLLNEASLVPTGSDEQRELYRAANQLVVIDEAVVTPLFYGGFGLYLQPNLAGPESSAWWCRWCPWC